MLLRHPDHAELGVRLAYGLNVCPTQDAAGVLEGLRSVSLPLRQRLFPHGQFSVGAWVPARAAREFLADEQQMEALLELCATGGLDPCTFNAFPFGGFHQPGLKERVFTPSWKERERLDFTLDVAELAVRLRAARGGSGTGQHLSLSTHAGMFAAEMRPGDRAALTAGFVAAAEALARLEERSGERVVLSIEPEPRSSANDTRELQELLDATRLRARGAAEAAVWRHLGACLDACHAAVEFEAPREAFERATSAGTTLGKLQFSSALSLEQPDRNGAGRARLLDLDEPTYLHQVTGRRGREFARVLDLPALAAEWSRAAPAWRGCDAWRCHFHVPVDLARLDDRDDGLRTTRDEAASVLASALARPECWGSRELHVEVETYTWNLLRSERPSAPALVDGLERELRHVLALLEAAGWHPSGAVDTPGA